LWANAVKAQGNLQHLKQQSNQLQEKVKLTEQLIQETQKHQTQSYNQLVLLQKQISLREKLVQSMNDELASLDKNIGQTENLVQAMQSDIRNLQNNMAQVTRVTYKSQNNLTVLLWLLSSESFIQAYNRLLYFRKFSEYRTRQVQLIARSRKHLQAKVDYFNEQRAEKSKLLAAQQSEQKKLALAKTQQADMVAKLKKKKAQQQTELKKAQQQLAAVNKQIQDWIIAQQKADAQKAKGKSGAAAAADQTNTSVLTSKFEGNKGKLPWPVPMNVAIVTGRFGTYYDEAVGGHISNDGVFITTPKGQKVRTVFNGVVTKVGKLPMVGHVVIIQHGGYRTVYANLEQVFVKEGDEVNVLQDIGVVKTNASSGETKLHFLIYKNANPNPQAENPEQWIARK
jgi:septal ring factor EnvC (AmiA/AmiB activator)